MPAKDGTGPQGMGPMTGKGMGDCCSQTGFAAKSWGRGCCGFGKKHGMGRMFFTKQDKLGHLEAYRDELKKELAGVEEALQELGK